MVKVQTQEEFYYEGEKVEKDTVAVIKSAKKGFSRTGILLLISLEISTQDGSVNKIEDWMDLATVYPLEKSFTLPRGTTKVNIDEERKKMIHEKDEKFIEQMIKFIENDDTEKVIKSISTKIASEKFGL